MTEVPISWRRNDRLDPSALYANKLKALIKSLEFKDDKKTRRDKQPTKSFFQTLEGLDVCFRQHCMIRSCLETN
jgi:hypothetical protein